MTAADINLLPNKELFVSQNSRLLAHFRRTFHAATLPRISDLRRQRTTRQIKLD